MNVFDMRNIKRVRVDSTSVFVLTYLLQGSNSMVFAAQTKCWCENKDTLLAFKEKDSIGV